MIGVRPAEKAFSSNALHKPSGLGRCLEKIFETEAYKWLSYIAYKTHFTFLFLEMGAGLVGISRQSATQNQKGHPEAARASFPFEHP